MLEIDKNVIEQGKSRLIILPKPWCDFWCITKKSKVKILADSIIVIVPEEAKLSIPKIKRIFKEGLR